MTPSTLRPFDSSPPKTSDEGVYVSLEDLIALEYKAKGFSFLPRQPIHSLLSGRHTSRMRGRGLNFEELRGYLPGDDIRTIDWKVTARTGDPHVRVYTEERDRPAFLIADQRLSMFFGSRKYMKSVVAAKLAALGAWRVFKAGDRVGAVVFNDSGIQQIRPHRSKSTVMQILGALAEQNRVLQANSKVAANPAQLNIALEGVLHITKHDYLIAIISDFYGLDDETTRMVTRLAEHNDVLAFPVFDPLSTNFPENTRLVVSNGELQIELETGKGSLQQRVIELADERLRTIMKWQEELAVPVLPLTTASEPEDQILTLLGSRTF